MEYVPGGELYSLLEKKGKLSEPEAKKYFYQVLKAIEYCHGHQVAHRDIKPENILLDESKNIKLGDFGLSNQMKDGEFLETACGSANYAAPEVIVGHKYCGSEVDIWSLGILLYALLTGTLPFDDTYMPSLIAKIKSAKFVIPFHVPPLASDLIKKLIVYNPMHRLALHAILEHPWISGTFPLSSFKVPLQPFIDEEIFHELIEHPKFVHLNNYEELKKNILSGDNYELFTVSYEMMLFAKMKEKVENGEVKKLFKKASCFNKKTKNVPNDWRYGFLLDIPPEEIMIILCELLRDIQGIWKFKNPFELKTIIKGPSKGFHIKFAIQLYSVTFI